MATTQSNAHQTDHAFRFDATGSLYSLSGTAHQIDIEDQLGSRLAQLRAMLIVASGDGSDAFNLLNEEIRQDYLNGAASLASECIELLELSGKRSSPTCV